MIEQPHRPIYKIKYTECKNDKQHEGEQLNIVCLSPNCRKKSLICSMCKSNQHSGHPTKPLKFYL